jgi:hypothetical protein
MGRDKPSIRDSQTVREEAALVRAVDEAAARVLPAKRIEITTDQGIDDQQNDDQINDVLAELEVAAPSKINLPIVFLDGFEITQEVQDLAHSVPLIAEKATIVRAYLRFAPAAVTVRGELLVSRSAHGPWVTIPSIGTADLDPSRSGSSPADLQTRRADLGFSLNFRLPPAFTALGRLWVRMGAVRRASGTLLPSLAWLASRTVSFEQAATLRIRLVRFRYATGTPPVTHEPSGTDATMIDSWLRRAYPAARLELTTTTVTANPVPPFTADQINAQLIALRAVDVSTGTDQRTHYYGMVSDGGFFMRGKASGIPQTPQPQTVASGPTGPTGFAWDTDGSYGDWYGAHELGHTFGRFHAEFCGAVGGAPYPFPNGQLSGADEAFVGVDVGDPALGLPMRIMGGVHSHDVMSYCDDEWLSSFTYAGIYDRLVAEDALPAGQARTLGLEPSPMRIIGALNLTRKSGTISAVLPTGGGVGATEGRDGADGTEGADGVIVRIRDAAGAILDERSANFQRSACADPGDDVTGTVDVQVPDPAGAATLELIVDGEVVDSQPIGGQAAVGELVQALRGVAGPGLASGQELELRWDAPGAPPSQRYIVQLSDDGGGSWRTVAVGLSEPALTLPPQELTGDTVTVRILATTGTGTTVIRTDTLPLA